MIALLAVSTLVLGAKHQLTPAEAVTTVRIVGNQIGPGQLTSDDFASPDGQRYLIRLVYGDVKRNGTWMDLLTGPLTSLEAASHPKRCAHLFTTGLGSLTSSQSAQADPEASNIIHWSDSTHIAFLWSDKQSVRQIMSVDLTTCKHRFLTHLPSDVFSFVATPDGSLLLNSQVPAATGAAEQLWAHGFTLGDNTDGLSILQGHIEDSSKPETMFKNAWFIRSHGQTKPLYLDGRQFDPSHPYYRDLSVGPTGRYAVIAIGVTSSPPGWEQYANPNLQAGLTSHQRIRLPVRYAVIDLHDSGSHMLWNSPFSSRGHVHWSPKNDTVLLAPTYLPLESNNPIGLTGNAAATIDVKSGEYHALPIDLTDRSILKIQWVSSTEIEIVAANSLGADLRTQRFTRLNGEWQALFAVDSAKPSTLRVAPVRLETRQSLNTPPQVFAVDTNTGASRLILDPNPHLLANFRLGRVERMSGTLPTGQQWIAQLIYPADYKPGTKYPLVIQSTYGPATFGAEEFTLQGDWGDAGMGLGPTEIACYPGQLLATRDIAVLELKVLHAGQGVKEAEDRQVAFEGLARQLSATGLADENKIALLGFSRNGYWVEYTLAHSSFPFAAAIAGDNYDPSYFQSALGNWRDMDVELNGSPEFGPGLQEWLAHAPGFNAEHIHAPLLIVGQSAGIAQIIGEWEIYSRLRHLNKPAQMYMMPMANTHPAHTPQNPQQILAIQETAIDWLEFWLTGQEDSNLEKREQYARWHRLKASSAIPNP
jgi:hypothetical protein